MKWWQRLFGRACETPRPSMSEGGAGAAASAPPHAPAGVEDGGGASGMRTEAALIEPNSDSVEALAVVLKEARPDDILEAAKRFDRAKVKECILSNADPNVRDEAGVTPLHMACHYEESDIAALLLKHGADPNAKTDRGDTPLHWAASYGFAQTVRILLKSGAHRDARNTDGRTATMIAALRKAAGSQGGYDKVIELLSGRDMAMGTIYDACRGGELDTVGSLLDGGMSPNSEVGKGGLTPLHEAVIRGFCKVAELLLDHGANVDMKDAGGRTPLHWAAFGKKSELVRLLLARGADPRVADNRGWDAMANAQNQHANEVIALLRSHLGS
jgi:ankyrin repeat protein